MNKLMMDKYKDTVRYMLLCLAGGLLGWLLLIIVNVQPATLMKWIGYGSLNDVAALPEAQQLKIMYTSIRIYSIFFSVLLSCGLVYAMSAAEIKTQQPWRKSLLKGLVFLAVAIPVGAVTGFLSGLIFESCYACSAAVQVLINGVGWGIIGIGIAVTVSMTKRSWKNILWYTAAGLLGGFITGVLFRIMSLPAVETDIFVRLISALIMGLLIGIGILIYKGSADRKGAPSVEKAE